MASELFGTPIGRSLAEQDMAREAMTGLKAIETSLHQDAAPSTAQQRSAQARFLNARSAGLETDAAIQARVAAMAAQPRGPQAGPNPDGGQPPDNPVWTLSELYLKAGDPQKAIKAAVSASGIDSRMAAVETNQAREKLIQARTRAANFDQLSRRVRNAESPEVFTEEIRAHEQATGESTGLLDQQGRLRPQVLPNWESARDELAERALTEKDRLTLQARQDALESAERARQARIKNMEFWQNMDNQGRRAKAVADARGKKAGVDIFDKAEGPKLGANKFRSEFLEGPKGQAEVFGRQISERAAEMRRLNPALTPTEAVDQAFVELDKAGKFEGLRKTPPVANRDKPLPLPADGDKKKLKTGFFYSDGKGVRQWLGDRWSGPSTKGKITSAPAGITPPASIPDDMEDDEDDELALED